MRYFFPPLILPLFVLFVILPFFALTFVLTTTQVFKTLFGISTIEALMIFSLIVVGSFVNLPVYKIEGREVVRRRSIFGIFYYYYVEKKQIVVAINVGGALIPSILAFKVLLTLPLFPALLSIVIASFLIYLFAKPIPGVGIVVPLFVPPLIALMCSFTIIQVFELNLLSLPKLAFVSGVFGSIVGADLMHLKDIKEIGSGVVSIGGAGTFDGIFLTGVFSVVFSFLLL